MAAVKLVLTERSGTRRQNLTGLKYAWFDEIAPNSFSAPTDTGTTETTDAEGVIEITLTGTSLVAGQYGCLAVSTSDDVDLGLYRLRVY